MFGQWLILQGAWADPGKTVVIMRKWGRDDRWEPDTQAKARLVELSGWGCFTET